jgi:flagellar biosynthesis/type III secretory pathway protein FliH
MEQSMIMLYVTFFQENKGSAHPEWVPQFEESIQTTIAKIDKYTPRDSRMVDEGKDSGYTDGYNQGLLEGHHNGWDEAKEYYH